MRVQWCQETLFQYWQSCACRHWKSEKKEWSRFHHSFCSKSTLDFNFFPISPNLFVDPFWLWTFCSFCSKSVTYFLSISSNLFARLFLAGCGLFVQQHLADVVWTEPHMLVCSTRTTNYHWKWKTTLFWNMKNWQVKGKQIQILCGQSVIWLSGLSQIKSLAWVSLKSQKIEARKEKTKHFLFKALPYVLSLQAGSETANNWERSKSLK